MNKILLIAVCLPILMHFVNGQSGTVRDIDGNVYETVRIGNQVWMAENLRTSRFNEGSTIGHVTDNTQWSSLTAAAWCWFSNNPEHEIPYGKLYNWYAIASGKLCPSGWHIPSDADLNANSEWKTLINHLGGSSIAGGKLKARGYSHWLDPNVGANNQSGFTGLPGGSRKANGTFDGIRFEGLWWNTMERDILEFSFGRSRILFFDSERVDYFDGDKRMGMSVRCIKG